MVFLFFPLHREHCTCTVTELLDILFCLLLVKANAHWEIYTIECFFVWFGGKAFTDLLALMWENNIYICCPDITQ